MTFKQLMHKAFVSGDWYVGYKDKYEMNTRYSIVPEDPKHWIADPFLFEYQNNHYLFVEYIESGKGVIAYYQFIDGRPEFQRIVLDEQYHLSYPCIFEYEGTIYMIPESADNNTVDLYFAVDYPDKWEKKGTLLNGRYYDSTILKTNDRVYLFTYKSNGGIYKLYCYEINIAEMKLKRISTKEYMSNSGRPAGNFTIRDGKLYRPSQDCSKMYGERILLNRVNKFDREGIDEEIVKVIDVGNNIEFQRIHTINEDSQYEVVDFFKERVNLMRPLNLIMKKLKQKG